MDVTVCPRKELQGLFSPVRVAVTHFWNLSFYFAMLTSEHSLQADFVNCEQAQGVTNGRHRHGSCSRSTELYSGNQLTI
jgi:hypothetical protein